MYVRINTSVPKKESIEEAVTEWYDLTAPLKKDGLVEALLFLDREAPQFVSVTIWESREHQQKNASSPAKQGERQGWGRHLTSGPVSTHFEVASTVK